MVVKKHSMEFPRKVIVGEKTINNLGTFITEFSELKKKVIIVSGPNVKNKFENIVTESLEYSNILFSWEVVNNPNIENAEKISKIASNEETSIIVGIGGGKAVDVSKLAAHLANRKFVSVPTSASHDGIASPFVSIMGLEKPYSLVARPPIGILADIDIIKQAPQRLLSSGCGDLISKITAVKDWQLAEKDANEYYGKYAANLALMSTEILFQKNSPINLQNKESIRDLVEALISTGVAAGIAGSSRPCSGSEHLISHALEKNNPLKGLHGEKCGIASIFIARIQDGNWERIREALNKVGCPTNIKEIGLNREEFINAIELAPKLRNRYTILTKKNLNRKDIESIIDETKIA